MVDLSPDDPDLLAAQQEGQAAIEAGDHLDADQLAEAMREAGRLPTTVER